MDLERASSFIHYEGLEANKSLPPHERFDSMWNRIRGPEGERHQIAGRDESGYSVVVQAFMVPDRQSRLKKIKATWSHEGQKYLQESLAMKTDDNPAEMSMPELRMLAMLEDSLAAAEMLSADKTKAAEQISKEVTAAFLFGDTELGI